MPRDRIELPTYEQKGTFDARVLDDNESELQQGGMQISAPPGGLSDLNDLATVQALVVGGSRARSGVRIPHSLDRFPPGFVSQLGE